VVDAVEANAGWWGQVVGDGHELWVPEVKVGGGCEWWAVESSGGQWSRVVGTGGKWWVPKPNGGC